MDSVRIRVL